MLIEIINFGRDETLFEKEKGEHTTVSSIKTNDGDIIVVNQWLIISMGVDSETQKSAIMVASDEKTEIFFECELDDIPHLDG